MAEATGTKQVNILRIESGLENPTLTFIQKIVKVLDIKVDFFQAHHSPAITVPNIEKYYYLKVCQIHQISQK